MKILIKNLKFQCIIGLLKKERVTAQNVIISVKLSFKGEDMVIDYSKVAKFIEKEYKKNKYFTLEESLKDIFSKLKAKYPLITRIKMKIYKPKILRKCDVGIELEKKY